MGWGVLPYPSCTKIRIKLLGPQQQVSFVPPCKVLVLSPISLFLLTRVQGLLNVLSRLRVQTVPSQPAPTEVGGCLGSFLWTFGDICITNFWMWEEGICRLKKGFHLCPPPQFFALHLAVFQQHQTDPFFSHSGIDESASYYSHSFNWHILRFYLFKAVLQFWNSKEAFVHLNIFGWNLFSNFLPVFITETS